MKICQPAAESIIVSHHNPVRLDVLTDFIPNIFTLNVGDLNSGLDILPGEPVELFRPQFCRCCCELPADVSPTPKTLCDGPGVSGKPTATNYFRIFSCLE